MPGGERMLAYIVIGALSAFGTVCALWTLCGFFLKDEGGVLFYQGEDPLEFARRYLWLKEMGLIRCQLTVADPPEEWLPWLRNQGIDVWSPAENVKTGERQSESGTGDPSGRHQRCGLSKL